MPIWEAALWAGCGPLVMEFLQIVSVVQRTRRLPGQQQSVLLSAFVVSALLRCALGAGVGVATASSHSVPSLGLVAVGMMVPVVFTQVARWVAQAESHASAAAREAPVQEGGDEAEPAAAHAPPVFSESVKHSFRGKRALFVAAGLTIASTHPLLAVPASAEEIQAASVVLQPRPSITAGRPLTLLRQSGRHRDNAPEQQRGEHATADTAPSADYGPGTAVHMKDTGGYTVRAAVLDFADGMGRIFDPLALTPPPPTPAAPDFIDEMLNEAFEQACSHGFHNNLTEPDHS